MGLDWEKVVEEQDGESCWGNWAWEDCLGPRRNSDNSSNRDCMSVSRGCEAAVSKPRSCVPVALVGHGKQGTLRRHGSVPDNMNNPDCELVVG